MYIYIYIYNLYTLISEPDEAFSFDLHTILQTPFVDESPDNNKVTSSQTKSFLAKKNDGTIWKRPEEKDMVEKRMSLAFLGL